ncbi:DUF6048 family protein [Chryseobacterium sp. T1]
MKKKLIFFLSFSCMTFGFSQKKAEDTIKKKWQYQPNFIVGVDVLNAGSGFFGDRKLYQGFISSRISRNVHAVSDLGFDKNSYDKNGYNATVNGMFVKLGAFYMLTSDPENHFNGFYGGGKVVGSFYKQEYFSVPIRGSGGGDAFVALAESQQSSYWVEAVIGGRVQLFDSNFFIDVNIQPRYLAYTTKQDELYPMIVAGFGKSSGKFGMGFSWNIAYKF